MSGDADTGAHLALSHVTDIFVEVDAPLEFGPTPAGFRRTVPIRGGYFRGPLLRGEILPGGADWQVTRPDGVTEVVARYALRTDDGALIHVVNRGFRHGPADVMRRLAAGEEVPPDAYYMRTSPRFETAHEDYAWLNRTIFVARGIRYPRQVVIKVFAVD